MAKLKLDHWQKVVSIVSLQVIGLIYLRKYLPNIPTQLNQIFLVDPWNANDSMEKAS